MTNVIIFYYSFFSPSVFNFPQSPHVTLRAATQAFEVLVISCGRFCTGHSDSGAEVVGTRVVRAKTCPIESVAVLAPLFKNAIKNIRFD